MQLHGTLWILYEYIMGKLYISWNDLIEYIIHLGKCRFARIMTQTEVYECAVVAHLQENVHCTSLVYYMNTLICWNPKTVVYEYIMNYMNTSWNLWMNYMNTSWNVHLQDHENFAGTFCISCTLWKPWNFKKYI